MASRSYGLRMEPSDHQAQLAAAQAEGLNWANWARKTLAHAAGSVTPVERTTGRAPRYEGVVVQRTDGRWETRDEQGRTILKPNGEPRTYASKKVAQHAHRVRAGREANGPTDPGIGEKTA